MSTTVFLITPPFTQLNTPYPATAYLKGFLNTINIDSYQADLGIETITKLFCKKGLEELFLQSMQWPQPLTENAAPIFALRSVYIETIDDVTAG